MLDNRKTPMLNSGMRKDIDLSWLEPVSAPRRNKKRGKKNAKPRDEFYSEDRVRKPKEKQRREKDNLRKQFKDYV